MSHGAAAQANGTLAQVDLPSAASNHRKGE